METLKALYGYISHLLIIVLSVAIVVQAARYELNRHKRKKKEKQNQYTRPGGFK